jgi:adenosylcobinamide-GDP ribazoletransferase
MSIGFTMTKEWPGQFASAWRFLTIIPFGRDKDLTPEKLGKSMSMFPAVGLVLGLVLVVLHAVLSPVFPRSLVDLLLITILIVMTGGLHMDGLADVIDGMAGGNDREGMLRIMRDSRIGAAGVVGLVLLILFKVVSLNQSPEGFKPALLLCMPCVGRWSMLQLASFSAYAREGEGTGRAFADFAGRDEFLVGLAFTCVVVFFTLRFKGILILFLIGGATYLMTRYFTAKLGGVTGDTQGFAGEFNEALFLLLGAVIL